MVARYHLPSSIKWTGADIGADEKLRIERGLMAALESALKARGIPATATFRNEGAPAPDRFNAARERRATQSYGVPSYDKQGALVDIPLDAFDPVDITVRLDRVVDQPPPFDGALALALPGLRYVMVKSRRHVTTDDPARAVTWGRAMFGATSFVITSRADNAGARIYYVAGLDANLTQSDLRPQAIAPSVKTPGVTARFSGLMLSDLVGGYHLETIYFTDGTRAARDAASFGDFSARLDRSLSEPRAPLDAQMVRNALFAPVDALLAEGDDEGAAALLSGYNAEAFGLLDAPTRAKYLGALTRAWTEAPQEAAIVEIFKSVGSLGELQDMMARVQAAGLWKQMFDDLDDELWSLLVTVGEKFGDKAPMTLEGFVQLTLEARLLPRTMGVGVSDKGVDFSIDLEAEAYEAARGFVRFVGDFVGGLVGMITHPDRMIDAVGQLGKLILLIWRAQTGDLESLQTIAAALEAVGAKILAGMKGVKLLGVGEQMVRRVQWAIVWEVASWLVGAGEAKAAAKAGEAADKIGEIARIVSLFRLGEKGVESERIAAKLQQVARLFSKSSKVVRREDEMLRLIARLPEEDVGRLGRALNAMDAADASRALAKNGDIADVLERAEVLGEFAKRNGGLTDEVADIFGRLARGSTRSPAELRALLKSMPEGVSPETMRMLAENPELLASLGRNPRAAKALTLCNSPCIPKFATPEQVARIEKALGNAESRGAKISQAELKKFLHDAEDERALTEAIEELEGAIRDGKPGKRVKFVSPLEDIKSNMGFSADFLREFGMRATLGEQRRLTRMIDRLEHAGFLRPSITREFELSLSNATDIDAELSRLEAKVDESLNVAHERHATPKGASGNLPPERTDAIGPRINPPTGALTDAEQLAANLTKKIGPRPPGHEAHHIVPKGMQEAEEARIILRDAGIGINDAENGIWLPKDSAVANEFTTDLHSKVHTRQIIKAITEQLRKGAREGGPDGVRRALRKIQLGLSGG